MPQFFADRVEVTTTSTGTGNLTLGAAVAGRRGLDAAGYVHNDRFAYRVSTEDGAAWEIGMGTLTKSGSTWTLARSLVLSSSAGGTTKANFAAGTKTVAGVAPAALMVAVGVEFSFVPPRISTVSHGIAIGSNAVSSGGVAVGVNTEAALHGVAIGGGAKAQAQRSVALGSSALVTAQRAVACPDAQSSAEHAFAFPGARAEKSSVTAQGFAGAGNYINWVGGAYSGDGWDGEIKDGNGEGLRFPSAAGVALVDIDILASSATHVYAARISAVARYGASLVIDGSPAVTVVRDTTGGEASAALSGSGSDGLTITVSSGELGQELQWSARVGAVIAAS